MWADSIASIRAQRILIWFSILCLPVFFIAWGWMMGFFPPPSPSLSAEQVLALYSAHNIRFRIGVALALIASGLIVPYSTVISLQMARLEKGIPVWAIVQLVTGVVGSAFFWGPFIVWGAAAFSVERDPALTLLLHELAWIWFITPLSLFPLQLVSIIIVTLTKDEDDRISAFPRWIGYLTGWQAVQSFGGPIALLFKSGIFSWSGLIPFWMPFVLFGAWIIALSYTMLRALRHQEGMVLTGAILTGKAA